MSSLFRSSHLRQTFTTIPKSIPKRSFSITRTMATSTPTPEKFEWLVILPDQPNKLAKRMEVRPTHFANLKVGTDSGFWKMGGALLEEVPKEGEGLKIQGSAMVAVAATKEEVIEYLKTDIYAKSEVWDFSKIQIYPFKCAFRYP